MQAGGARPFQFSSLATLPGFNDQVIAVWKSPLAMLQQQVMRGEALERDDTHLGRSQVDCSCIAASGARKQGQVYLND